MPGWSKSWLPPGVPVALNCGVQGLRYRSPREFEDLHTAATAAA